MRHKPPLGATPRLSERERAELPELLERGAEAHGFRGEAWTCERVGEVIRREYGVSYHPAHVSRLLRELAFPCKSVGSATKAAFEAYVERVLCPILSEGQVVTGSSYGQPYGS